MGHYSLVCPIVNQSFNVPLFLRGSLACRYGWLLYLVTEEGNRSTGLEGNPFLCNE
jgi:hypothetical protein